MSMCTAYYADLGARCGRPGVRVRRACVHEHVSEAVACEFHIEDVANGYCLRCLNADGHDCPITIVPVGGAS